MANRNEEHFSFISHGLDPDTFSVVRFQGTEHLSECYRYEILLASENAEISFDDVLQNPATLTVHGQHGTDMPVNGVPVYIEQDRKLGGLTLYKITLRPKLFWLTLTHSNQIFLDKSLEDIIGEVLVDGGLNRSEFEFRLQGSYPEIDYVCQFRETHLYFISRWMERAGMYYFFEQTDSGEKLVITDSKMSHKPFRQQSQLTYAESSGLGDAHREESIQSFVCRQHVIPGKVRVKDYNYEKPDLDVEGEADTQQNARGEIYVYGGGYASPEEAKASAQIRADAHLCREQLFHAETTVPGIAPGTLFSMGWHSRNDFNREYLAIGVSNEGSQEAFLTSGISEMLGKKEQEPYYRNSVTAASSDIQYRSECKHKLPYYYGTLSGAKIDAAGFGRYAKLDDEGRYKVIMPFDLSGRKDGKALKYLRMMQPYAGTDYGMHLPLCKGTEVLISFIGGDPDRPVIAGALPNPETPSPVTSKNETMGCIKTASGNTVQLEDKEGGERILIDCPKQDSLISIGATSDSLEDEYEETSKEGITISTEKNLDISVGEAYTLEAEDDSESHFHGDYKMEVEGSYEQHVHGDGFEMSEGWKNELFLFEKTETNVGTLSETRLLNFNETTIGIFIEITLAFKLLIEAGWQYTIGSELTELRAAKNRFILNEDEITALKELVVADELGLLGETNVTNVNRNTVNVDLTNATVNLVQVVVAQSDVVSEQSAVIADNNAIVGAEDVVAGAMVVV